MPIRNNPTPSGTCSPMIGKSDTF